MDVIGLIGFWVRNVIFTLWIVISISSAASAEAPKVVTSILPLNGLAAAVMEGVGKPELLMPGDQSPHDYQMLPSQARSLESADLVFWIGPGLEGFLSKSLKTLASKAKTIPLVDVEGISFPEKGEGHHHKHKHEDGHEDEHKDEAGHDDGDEHDEDAINRDHHIWLNPQNAMVIANEMAKQLSAIDPTNKQTYETNALKFVESLKKLDGDLKERFAPVHESKFLVFHQAYRHFEEQYGLSNAGTVISHHEVSPGAKRVRELNELMATGTIKCVFSEPQYDPKLARSLVANSDVKTAILDPLGQGTKSGPNHYIQLIRTLAQSMQECLS